MQSVRGAGVVCLGLVLGSAAPAGEPPTALKFLRHTQATGELRLSELREMPAARTIRVFEPYEEREVAFHAVPLPDVLDAAYSSSWREEEELLFTCLDGYQPGIPVARVLAHSAWLAFGRADQDDFAVWKHESGRRQWIPLAPLYLVWENLSNAQLRDDGDYGWPYQLTAIDLVRTRDRFPNMLPPEGASRRAQAGFREFRAHCSRCHRINGDGGTIGQELNDPVSPLDYRDSDWLARWISDPRAVNPETRMPPLNLALADRERVIRDILEYLETMAAARPEPRGSRPDGR